MSENFTSIAFDSLKAQAKALEHIADTLDENFNFAVNAIMKTNGRTILSGMGKSGLVGQKIAATLASTGTPSLFLHPAEAFHGDLGMITSNDMIILLSYSGETEEVTRLIPSLQRFGNQIISIVGNPESTIAKHSDIVLNVKIEREICPNNLAPTTSTIATMAMGDALAVALMKARNFKPEDFARLHPGGSLGKKLLTRVKDVMRKDYIPMIDPNAEVREALFPLSRGRMGLVLVQTNGHLEGIVTDGDLRRAMINFDNFLELPIHKIMCETPKTVPEDSMLFDAEELMIANKIKAIVATNEEGKVSGILEIFD